MIYTITNLIVSVFFYVRKIIDSKRYFTINRILSSSKIFYNHYNDGGNSFNYDLLNHLNDY